VKGVVYILLKISWLRLADYMLRNFQYKLLLVAEWQGHFNYYVN